MKVTDKKDGKLYECKVLKTSANRVKVHYVGWNRSRDEWLQSDDPRIKLATVKGPNRASSLEPNARASHSDRTSAEVEIDNLHDRLCSSQPNPRDLGEQQTSERAKSRKRNRDPDSIPRDEVPPKRSFFHVEGQPILVDEASSPLPQSVDAGASGSASASSPDAAPMQSSTPQVPQDASVIAADPGTGDGGVVLGVPGNNINITCRLCQLPIDQMKVKCNSCNFVFHADPLCLGVNKGAALALVADVDGALTYRCCNCRFSSSVDKVGLTQLLNMVGQAVRAIRVDRAPRSSPQAAPDDQDSTNRVCLDKESILAQVREVREREKRKDSVIIRGFSNINEETLIRNIQTICDLIDVEPVVLSDIKMIGGTNIYRARIVDADRRQALLMKCHQLRPTEEFRNVYINRDLTYQQRRDLRSRRNQSRSGTVTQPTSGANSIPVSQDPPPETASVVRIDTVGPGTGGSSQADIHPTRGRPRGRPRGTSRSQGAGRGQARDSARGGAQSVGSGRPASTDGGSDQLTLPAYSRDRIFSSQRGRAGPGRSSSSVVTRPPGRDFSPAASGAPISYAAISRPSTSDGRTREGHLSDTLNRPYSSDRNSNVHFGGIPHQRRNLNL